MSKNSVMETITAVVAALVLVFALGAIGMHVFGSEPEAADKTHADVQETMVSAAPVGEEKLPAQAKVVMPISQSDFDSSATLIPVNIEGTDENNQTFTQLQFCNGIGDGVRLGPGTYRLTFPAGYITGSGTVYRAPEGTIRAEVPEGISDGESVRAIAIPPREEFKDNYVSDEIREAAEAAANSSIILEFTEVPVLDVTQEMLDEIASYTKQDPSDNGRTKANTEAALSLQRKAITEKEEAERKAAAEEKARLAEEKRLAAEEESRLAMEEQRRAVEEEARRAAEEEAKKKAEEEAKKKAEEEAAQRQQAEESAPASASMLDGWWTVVDRSVTQYTHFANGVADVYDDGTASESEASLVSTSAVKTCERLTSEQEGVVGEGGYLIYLDGASSCYVIRDSSTDVLELRSYPDLRTVNADKSLARTTPPDNVAALVQ